MLHKIRIYSLGILDIVDSFLYDFLRYWKHSQILARFKSRKNGRAFLLMAAHALEKGLALPERKPGFGKQKAHELLQNCSQYLEKFGPDDVCVYVSEVVDQLLAYHNQTGHSDPSLVGKQNQLKLRTTATHERLSRPGGLLRIEKHTHLETLPKDAYQLFASRHSVRQFGEGGISESVIHEAARIAQTTPSVCNRQSSRIHYTTDPEVMSLILKHQQGADGFGGKASVVLIFTSELGAFNRAGERSQAYVDGGMFAMTYALALHALGYGTCFLNWSKTARQDRRLRKAVPVPESEVIITVMVAGPLPNVFEVASSPRIATNHVIKPIFLSHNPLA